MSGVALSDLAAACPGCRLVGADVAVGGIASDSRRVRAGDLFAALPGTITDGLRFAPAAVAAGAAAILLPVGAEGDAPAGLPLLACDEPRRATGVIAQRLAGDPSLRLRLTGVTGTNGKSSAAAIIAHLLGDGLIGTLGFAPGDREHPATHTTPDAVTLAALLSEAVAAGRRGVAMEASSHALDQERVAGCRFAGVLFTNLSRDHLDYHGDMASYLAAKSRLLGLRAPGAPALLNTDDAAFGPLLAERDDGRFGVGRREGAEFRIVDERLEPAGSRFRLVWAGGEAEFSTRLPGAFNVENVAGALALCLAMGEPADRLAGRLETFAGLPGRMERVALAGGPDVIVDFAHTPDAVARVLDACRPLCAGRLVALLGAGGDRDRGKRPLMGAAAQAADAVILTSDNPRSEAPEAIIDDIEAGMDPVGAPWRREPDRGLAIRLALADLRAGDLLVLLGKGHEATQEIAGRRLPFSDRAEALAAWAEGGLA